jgi:UDP-glucose 4-epimerase
VVAALSARGDRVHVVDDLSTGQQERVRGVPLARIDLASHDAVEYLVAVMRDSGAEAVVHLAARKRVDESVVRPDWYRDQNVGGLAHLLAAAEQADVRNVIFSSTAAVYASADRPVREDDPTAPPNPYGETKLAG